LDGFATLLHTRYRILRNLLRTFGDHSRLKILAIATLGAGIWITLFFLPFLGFEKIDAMLPGAHIEDLLISLFFFMLMVMLVFSNGVIAYTALMRSRETWFLRACPLPPGTVFLYKLLESLAFSSWAFLLLGVPIMLAYGVFKNAPLTYYGAMFVFFLSFILIPAGLGALLALLISALLRPWMRRLLTGTAIGVALVALVVASYQSRGDADSEGLFGATTLLSRIGFTHNVYWPSSWIARGLALCAGSAGAPQRPGDIAYYLGLLLSHSLGLLVVACWFAGRVYDHAWDKTHSSSSPPRSARRGFLARRLDGRSPMLQLIGKDLRTFVRDPVQWTQCAVLFGLLGLYILNLRNLRYPTTHPVWRNLTTSLNLGSICLVLATLTTRFVFPMFSLEGRRFWVLGLMPIRRRQILWAKFWFAFIGSLVITEFLMVLSDLMLQQPWPMILLHMVTVALISAGLSGMAVGLSALYPNLRENSPAKIVSGFGGTLNLILSLLFVTVVVAVQALPLHLHLVAPQSFTTERLALGLGGGVALTVVLAGAAFGVPMWLGSRALARMEF